MENKTMNLDAFGEIMDKFIRESEIQMLITLPEGSVDAEVQDNVKAGGVMQFYIMLNAFPSVVKRMKEDMKRADLELDESKWEDVVDALLELLKKELMEEEDEDFNEKKNNY